MLLQPVANAQLLNIKIGSDALVEAAIRDAIVMVESGYCIQDIETNQKYGRNGQSFFNKVCFLGCKSDKGIIASEKVLTPWCDDDSFDKYRDNKKYRPLLDSTIIVRTLPVNTVDTLDIATGLSYNNDSTLICSGNGDNRADGLILSSDSSSVVNWIVWVRNPEKNESTGTPEWEFSVIKKSIDFSEGDRVVDAPNSPNSYIGGLYISARIISAGMVEFSLSGFTTGTPGKWIVEPVNDKMFSSTNDTEDNVIPTPETNQPDDNLTPVKEKNKEKKKKSKASKKK